MHKKSRIRSFLLILWVAVVSGQATTTESFLGNLALVMRSIQRERGFPMDYAYRHGMRVEEWRSRGRAEVQRALSYSPKTVPLDVQVHSTVKRSGCEIRSISYAGSAHYRVTAYLLMPTQRTGPFPAVVALHDHGGWFYHGKAVERMRKSSRSADS